MGVISRRELDIIYSLVDDALTHQDIETLGKLDTLPVAHRLVGYQFAAHWHKREDEFQQAAIQGFVRAADEITPLPQRRKLYKDMLVFLRNSLDISGKPSGDFQKTCAQMMEKLTPPSATTKIQISENIAQKCKTLRPLGHRVLETLRLVA